MRFSIEFARFARSRYWLGNPLGRLFIRFCFLAFVLFFAFRSVFASSFIYEAFISIEPSKIEFLGASSGGQFGASTATGDFNGDFIDDLAIGSPFASMESREWNGSVSIIFGKKTFDINKIDLAETSTEVIFFGAYSGDQLGTALSSGDFNNDGIADIAMSSYNAFDFINEDRPGKVYVFYGKTIWENSVIDLSIQGADVEMMGRRSGDKFGLALEVLDINNDDVDDLLVGSPMASSVYAKNAGIVFSYFGSERGLPISSSLNFYGRITDERFGASISGGDINGDEKTDVIIGAYFASKQAGKIYLYTDFKPTISSVKVSNSFIAGEKEGEWFGFSLDVADINGDSFDDIAVGSFPYIGNKDFSKFLVFYGNQRFDNIPDLRIENPVNGTLIGASVLLDDIDFDSKIDMIFGALGVGDMSSGESGNVYVISGKDYIQFGSSLSIKDNEFSSVIHGENADDWFGYGLDSFDFNADGYKDLVISSRYSDSEQSVNNGKVFVIFGGNYELGEKKTVLNNNNDFLKRDEFIRIVLDAFDIENKKADEIKKCYEYKEFCLFNFMAMSSYDGIQIDPDVVLYPDISIDNEYYEDITAGTMLGLINGYLNEGNSPFHPEFPVSRIQALKIVLGASDLVLSQYRFELINELGAVEKLTTQFSYFADVNPQISYMWWYPRYVNFGVENGLIDKGDLFRPDDNITMGELIDLIQRTKDFLVSKNEEADS